MMKCPVCSEFVPPGARNCVACQQDVGFPNVRAAGLAVEVDALDASVDDAKTSTEARGCKSQLESFGKAVLSSSAVICRSIAVVKELIDSENRYYPTFYNQTRSGGRVPEDNSWDNGRVSVDAILFPHYHEEIRFGAISLNKRGLFGNYGGVCIVLKEAMIIHRATVFEENPFNFCRKHNVVAGTKPPSGYRAKWKERDKLAMAKLHGEIAPSTNSSDFPAILLKDTGDGAKDDFIEVHIFGSFNRSAVEFVTYPKPTNRTDRTLIRSLTIQLNKLGIPHEAFE